MPLKLQSTKNHKKEIFSILLLVKFSVSLLLSGRLVLMTHQNAGLLAEKTF